MINGIININKEKGFTSHDVIAKLRGIIGQKKIGHTGTLDPDATGVLPVCLGRATKVCDLLTNKDKTYEATLVLGVSTDTQDLSGQIIEEKDTSSLTKEAVREALLSFVGPYNQVPPMYSALKVDGKKLYELAREGKSVERAPRKREIYNIEITKMELPKVKFIVKCSKGTYIRTLCHDVGIKLSVGGAMEDLKRTKVGNYTIGEAYTLAEVAEKVTADKLEDILQPIAEVFSDYPSGYLNKKREKEAYNGGALSFNDVEIKEEIVVGQKIRLFNQEEEFVGLYEKQEDNYKLIKIFYIK